MKIVKYISLALVLILSVSCTKQEIEYMTTPLPSDMAEFQLHYVVPVASVSTNYIYRVEVNDSLLTNATTPLTAMNAIPNGAIGKFFTVTPGTVNIKLYKSTGLTLAYDQNVTLTSGKQNVFVYDYNQPPKVFDNGYPYKFGTTLGTDSVCYVKFYNFLYESTGVPTTLRLQYQFVDTHKNSVTGATIYSDTINVGNPVSFGETTGWQPVKVVKSIFNSSGYNTVYYRIKVIDSNGHKVGELSVKNTSGVYKDYSDYWTEYIGRYYHHVLGGIRTETSRVAAVSVFTAL